MTGTGVKIEVIELLQLAYAFQRDCVEWGLAVESMQHDALQDVAQGHVVVLGKPLQNFQDSFFNPHPGLHALDEKLGIACHVYQCTTVPRRLQAECLVSAVMIAGLCWTRPRGREIAKSRNREIAKSLDD